LPLFVVVVIVVVCCCCCDRASKGNSLTTIQ
jgi:hypothetical protein